MNYYYYWILHNNSDLHHFHSYPIYLTARYRDRIACYNTVYITSEIPLERQYRSEQEARPQLWNSFLERIHNVIEFAPDGEVRETIFNDLPLLKETTEFEEDKQ